MSEGSSLNFKKLFGGFRSRSASCEPEPPETPALQEQEPTPPLEPPAPVQEEKDAFGVPSGNPLAKVWALCNQPGTPTLNPRFAPDCGRAVPENALEKNFYKILRQLSTLSQSWLDMEASAAQARDEADAAAAAARAETDNAEAPSQSDQAEPVDAPIEETAKAEPSLVSDQAEADDKPDGTAIEETVPPAPLDVDEMAQVLVSGDGMVVWMLLLPPSGNGRRLSVADGGALLRDANVTVGIDQDALQAIFDNKTYFCLCPVAWGTPPICGKDGWTEDHFQRNFVRGMGNTDTGIVDYRAQSNVQAISKDAVICDIYPPVEGIAGLRVDGVAVPPPPVKEAAVPAGSNTVLSEDGTKLLAGIDGFLEFRGNLFEVKNLLNITSDVDYSTGNIDFRGDVTIRGDVREQFSVKATGNITIDGLVEAATVEAGGDVVISNGVSGNGQAVIRGNHVRAKYVENSTVFADTLEADYILSSRISCTDSILASGSRGAIIGGEVIAAKNIKASRVGSQSGSPTEIILGVQPKLREELNANRKQLMNIRTESSELVKRVAYLKNRMERSRPDERSIKKIQAAELRLSQLAEEGATLLSCQRMLMEQLNGLAHCRLESSLVYPGVRLTIGGASQNIESAINKCVAVFDAEEHNIKFV